MAHTANLPLCVDLDGTLIRSDATAESILQLIARSPLTLLRMPLWLSRGRAYFKRRVAERCLPDASLFPYRELLVDYLKDQHKHGRKLILATASDQSIADDVADHLKIFDLAIGSDGRTNRKAKHKLAILEQKFGAKGFVYAGNSRSDIPVWLGSGGAILVDAPGGAKKVLKGRTPIEREITPDHSVIRELLRAMRPHQWMKNLLIFVPIFTAHRFVGPTVEAGILAFASFCLAASAGYLFNDLLDISSDRAHPRKRNRPVASGKLSVVTALVAIVLLVIAAIALSWDLPAAFYVTLVLYMISTVTYSALLKRIMMLDVIVLSLLYTLRIVAGTVATGVAYSAWLMAFSLFFFFNLALLKRYCELIGMRPETVRAAGRGYHRDDTGLLSGFGAASGCIAVFVLALYVNSPDVVILYRHPTLLWLICPILLYFLGRAWIMAHRNKMHDDPVIFALTDPVNLAMWGSIALITVAAI